MEIGWTKLKEASVDWDDAKIKATDFNCRALNALFSAVTNEEFKKIFSTEIAKEAWTILQTTYERTKAVKDSKLQRLTLSFEEIKMEEDESFDEILYHQAIQKVYEECQCQRIWQRPQAIQFILVQEPRQRKEGC